jgi:hypothetical protein
VSIILRVYGKVCDVKLVSEVQRNTVREEAVSTSSSALTQGTWEIRSVAVCKDNLVRSAGIILMLMSA